MSDKDSSISVGVIYGVRLARDSGYRYVGLTTKTATSRLRQHLKVAASGRRRPFYDWLRKHTPEDLAVDVLETVTTDLEALGLAEIAWIASRKAAGDRLLNLSLGGLGPTGFVWTEEQREAARVRSTGRQGLSRPGELNPFHGGKHSEAQRQRWSELRRGTNVGAENINFGRFGAAHPGYGRVMSPEERAQLSEQRRGPLNPNYGKTASAETRAKRSAAQKGIPKPSSARSAHTRYHTNKGVESETCRFCTQTDLTVQSSPTRETNR
jgi:hypothetical protein